MLAILTREVKNYVKHPLFWIGVVIVIWGVYSTLSPYLTIHYLAPGETIENDYPETIHAGEVYEGYIPSTPAERRYFFEKSLTEVFVENWGMSIEEADAVIDEIRDMDIDEACGYLEQQYSFIGAISNYQRTAYKKGTADEINSYLVQTMEKKPFSFYFSRKFADFAGLFMGFFATILLSVLYMQDTRKHTYELLHTKPVGAGSYVLGKILGGFSVCLITLGILNLVFFALCRICTKSSGFEVRLFDFVTATCLYILPNMLMIVCIYSLISLLFQNPLPAVPLLLLHIVYSNMGGRNAQGVYGYYGRPLAIMVRFPGQLFDTAPPPKILLNQSFLIAASAVIVLISIYLWKRRRM